jgi:hypothetical protein
MPEDPSVTACATNIPGHFLITARNVHLAV